MFGFSLRVYTMLDEGCHYGTALGAGVIDDYGWWLYVDACRA